MSTNSKIGVFVTIVCVILVSQAPGQDKREKIGHQPALEIGRAWQEVIGVLSETSAIKDKNTYVRIQGKTASLIWLKDEELGRALFNELWVWVENQRDENFNSETARTDFLRCLMLRDAKLSKNILEGLPASQKNSDKSALSDSTAQVKRINSLASDYIDNNPSAAAELLEQSVPVSPTIESLSLLARLQEKDSNRADKIVFLTLNQINQQPIQIALPSIYSLHYYLFPLNASRKTSLPIPPSQALQTQYFQAAMETLLRSLQNTEINPSSGIQLPTGSLSQRIIQIQLAFILSALSSRFAPDRVEELSRLKEQISLGMSAEITGVARATAGRLGQFITQKQVSSQEASTQTENPISVIGAAMPNDEAFKLLEKIDNPVLKSVLLDQMKISESDHLLEIGRFADAAQAARNISSLRNRVSALIKVAKLSNEKGDGELSESLIAEVERYFSSPDCDRNKLSILLTVFLEVGSFDKNKLVELLASGVECVNKALPDDVVGTGKAVGTASAQSELASITQAFSLAGQANLDTTLAVANQIRNRPAQLYARLFACEKWLLENQKDEKPSVLDKHKKAGS
jgi:hypothetical protein